MALIAGAPVKISAEPRVSHQIKAVYGISGWQSVSFSSRRKGFSSIRMQPAPMRLCVSCVAKPETVQKVCEIVKEQLALSDDSSVTGESKFSALGADSLDTVEIVMGLEEAFEISVEEDSAQSITTVQDAADLIEDLVAAKSA